MVLLFGGRKGCWARGLLESKMEVWDVKLQAVDRMGKTSDLDFQAVRDVDTLRIQLVIVTATFKPSMSLRSAWSLEDT